jgi:hypothetical protein
LHKPDFTKSVPKSVWNNASETDKQNFAIDVFNHYRAKGFPIYNLTPEERRKEFVKLLTYFMQKGDTVIDGDQIRQTMHGLALAWSYMHHSWGIKVGNMKTPYEIYNNDDLFLKAIRRRMERGDYISDSGMRKALRTYSGAQSVSNFRPTAAAAIYRKYAGYDATVWDMSCGYGGRLLGAMIAQNVTTYIGTDPAADTMKGLLDIAMDFAVESGTFVELRMQGSEITFLEPESIDFAFTSPPYFDTEKYSEEETQSYKKFSTVEAWNEGFLRSTIRNAYIALKHDKYMLLNVADVKSHKTLVEDTKRIAIEEGFVFEEELKLLLSSITKGGYKYEPVLVFKKP